MNDEQKRVIQELRQEGYAVIVWTPEELRDANADSVEERSIELGWDVIDALANTPRLGDDEFVCVHCGDIEDIENSVQTDVGLVCTFCESGFDQKFHEHVDTWRFEVQNGDTKLGFEEWMRHQRTELP